MSSNSDCCSTKPQQQHNHQHNGDGHDHDHGHDHSHDNSEKTTFQLFFASCDFLRSAYGRNRIGQLYKT